MKRNTSSTTTITTTIEITQIEHISPTHQLSHSVSDSVDAVCTYLGERIDPYGIHSNPILISLDGIGNQIDFIQMSLDRFLTFLKRRGARGGTGRGIQCGGGGGGGDGQLQLIGNGIGGF